MSFEWVKEQAIAAQDDDILAAVAAIEPFQANNMDHIAVKNQGLVYFRGGDFYTEGLEDRYLDYALTGQSPYYTQAEVENYMPARQSSLEAVVPQALDYDLFRDVPTSSIPVHFLVGEHDFETPAELSREYYRALDAPSKSYTVIESSGHDLILDAPAAWSRTLIAIASDTL